MSDIAYLVKKYEAGNDPGVINHHDDDKNGCSYGLFQFYSGAGTVSDFMKWCKGKYPIIYAALFLFTPSTDLFNTAWQTLAKIEKTSFAQAQYDYAKALYYDIAKAQLAKIPCTLDNDALNAVIFSCAIQYSPYKVPTLFQKASKWVGVDITKIADADVELLICGIYYLRCTDEWNKGKRTMCHRFMMECTDALSLI